MGGGWWLTVSLVFTFYPKLQPRFLTRTKLTQKDSLLKQRQGTKVSYLVQEVGKQDKVDYMFLSKYVYLLSSICYTFQPPDVQLDHNLTIKQNSITPTNQHIWTGHSISKCHSSSLAKSALDLILSF